MKTLILALVAAASLLVADEANAQRRFLFPNIVANRQNAQARANIAVANANVAANVAAASRGAVVFAAPVVVGSHHRNNLVFQSPLVFAAPVYRQAPVVFSAPVLQAPAYYPTYAQAQVFQAPLAPVYAPQVFSSSAVQYSASSICGF